MTSERGFLLNVLSLYFSGETLIFLIHNVPSCCDEKKLNVPFQSMSSMACFTEGHRSVHCVRLSVHTVCFLTAGVTAVVILPIVYGLSWLNGGLLLALRLCVNRH